MQAFQVSEATISRDKAKVWSLLAKTGAVEFSKGKLVVVRRADLELPKKVPLPRLDEWLHVMMNDSFVQKNEIGRAEPRDEVVRAVVHGIQEKKALRIRYLSKSTEDDTQWRFISPHRLAQIAGRYHAHCWDHKNGETRDFVLTRIRAAVFSDTEGPAYRPSSPGDPWQQDCKLEITAASAQSLAVARADYGLNEAGFSTLTTCRALAGYLVTERQEGFEDLVRIAPRLQS